jgi:DNA-binding transcriptional regulator YhcF (GntR family)
MELPETPSPPLRRADAVETHCLYAIATGRWPEGTRLPSVRAAERRFGVDRRTVMEAYGRLVEKGLAERRDRAGYYVRSGPALGRIARHRHELDRLFERAAGEIRRDLGLSPLGVFRYFAQLAGQRASEAPECAFVECTRAQASAHAAEVARRFELPCLPLSLAELDGRRARVPRSVRTLLVSAFHFADLQSLGDDELTVTSVPIEVSPTLADPLRRPGARATVFDADEQEARDMRDDVARIAPHADLDARGVPNPARELLAVVSETTRSGRLALLSPRLSGVAPESLRTDPRVLEVEFRVRPDAWPSLADALGLPLGAV